MATMRQHRSQDLGTFDQGRAKLQAFAGANSKHLVKSDLGSNVGRYLFYFEFFASDNLILLATGFYDRVHEKPHRVEWGLIFLSQALGRIGKTANYTCT